MKLLAIDPGETVGLALLQTEGEQVTLLASLDVASPKLKKHLPILLAGVAVVVIEDYRIFATHAGQHIGARLLTSELIGFIEAHCGISTVPVVRIQPNEKGRWPEARIKAKHPEWTRSPGGHARDALKLGLVYLEKEAKREKDAKRSRRL